MSSAAGPSLVPPSPYPRIEGANLLNLVIVDDERSIRESCREVGQALGFSTSATESAEHVLKMLDAQAIDVVLLDLKAPGTSGLHALRAIKQKKPDAAVIVVTGFASVPSAVAAMKEGAYDYVTKPFSMDELRVLLHRVTTHLKTKSENRMLRERVKAREGFGAMIGRAPEMKGYIGSSLRRR
jgi:DNA-binding NtrC family response regulator